MPALLHYPRTGSVRQATKDLDEALTGIDAVQSQMPSSALLAQALKQLAHRHGYEPEVLVASMRQSLRELDLQIEMAASFIAEVNPCPR